MTNNKIVIVCFLSWLAFIPAILFAPRLYVFDFLNAFGFTFGVLVLWRYGPGAMLALKNVFIDRTPIGRGAMLILGIETTWFAMVARSLILWVWRWYGEPDGGLDGFDMAFIALTIICGGACHLAASTMSEDNVEVPRFNARLFKMAGASGLLLGAGIAFGRYSVA